MNLEMSENGRTPTMALNRILKPGHPEQNFI
jgi:hypothetical protein